MVLGGEHFEAWGAIETSIRTGQTAFDARHGTSWIDYYTAHPQAGRAFAEAKGVVFDLPEVIAGWPARGHYDLDCRFTGVGGDFFQSMPKDGDLYLLKMILHDWDDERAVTILQRVREALRPGGWVAIVETVLPDTPTEHPGWLLDLNMLALTGGRERTATAYASLLECAGLRFERVVPNRSSLSVILARAA